MWDQGFKRVLMGTPHKEPQEHNRNMVEHEDPGRYIPVILLLYSWGSLFRVPTKNPFRLGFGRWSLGGAKGICHQLALGLRFVRMSNHET